MGVKNRLAATVIESILDAMQPENAIEFADTLIDYLEDKFPNSRVIQGLCKMLREAYNIPDNDEPEPEETE